MTFSLSQFIRSSGQREFKMQVVSDEGEELEMEISAVNDPSVRFSVYIENNSVFGKHALDGFKKHFGQYLRKPSKKERTDDIFKSMIQGSRK
jgi:hypothetical protein